MSHQIVPQKTYILVFLSLIGLTMLTTGVAFIDLGPFNTVVALIIAVLHVIRPSIVLLTGGLIVAGFGIVLYNVALSGLAIGLLILGFARPAPATA